MIENMKIKLVPNNILREKSREVAPEEFGEDLDLYMDRMIDKMKTLNGVGLSGIQIGDKRRIIVADIGEGPIKMVNPEILEESEEKVVFAEMCLSAPGLRLGVERSESVKVKCLTPLGEPVEGVLTGLEAIVIQHEIDHLNGICLTDRMSNLKRGMYLKKLKKMLKKLSRQLKSKNN